VPFTSPLPVQRSIVALVTIALALGALLPFLAPAPARAQPTDLFFSEYIEGSSFNKALEIFNGTGSPVDLAAGGYSVFVSFNGGMSTQEVALSGTIASGDVFVIANTAADSVILAQADLFNNAVANFNGDDAIALQKADLNIDVIGQIGFDPGTEWGIGNASTQDNTIRRKASVEAGDNNGSDPFDPAVEWDGFANNNFTSLGYHPTTNPTGVGAANPASVALGAQTLLAVAVTPGTNPTSTALAVSADLTPIGGIAAQAFFDDGTNGDETAGDGTFSFSANVGGTSGDKVITAAISDAQARSGAASISLTVVGDSTGPTGVGAADPSTVVVGNSTTLTVAVTPGTNPDSSGLTVTADLSSIGGSGTQSFFDDGTNGDVTVGDNTFTFTATVPATVTFGAKVLLIDIDDAEGRSSTTQINLSVEGEPSEIWEIQGTSHLSAFDGDQVFNVEGIVTAVGGNGYWMTDPTPDADVATSDGIFVFRGSGSKPDVGQHVRLDATVDEFRPGGSGGFENLTTTELVSVTSTEVLSSGNDLPTTVIGVDRVPPVLVIDNDSTTSVEANDALFDPAQDGIDFWESLEGMHLEVADAVAVGPRVCFGATCSSREIAVISQQQTGAGVRTPRDGILVRQLGAAGDYRSGDFNPERLILVSTLAGLPDVNVGDEFAPDPGVVGVLDYSFGNFKLLVTTNPVRVDNGLVPETTADDGPRDLSVATFNVENLSPLDTDAKVERLATQIVQNLKVPDIIAVQEIQDNTGPTNDGVVNANESWQRLIDAIATAGGPTYQFRQVNPTNNADGGAPGGNIRVGFLFLPSPELQFVTRVAPGNPNPTTTDTDVVKAAPGSASTCGGRAQLTMSPGRILDAGIGGAAAFHDTRKSLAGEFCFRGETVFVVANHLSSKGDDEPLFGHSQAPLRFTEFESGTPEDGWRHAQAQAINDFVDEILAVDKRAHVIVLGDINDFDFSETVDILTGERVVQNPGPPAQDVDGSGPTAATGAAPVLTSLFDRLPADQRYSYVFDGNSQVLDQILVSSSLIKAGPSYDVVHVNAEFFDQASDHDPSVMVVPLGPGGG
jgi:predicted extracellular nuclease